MQGLLSSPTRAPPQQTECADPSPTATERSAGPRGAYARGVSLLVTVPTAELAADIAAAGPLPDGVEVRVWDMTSPPPAPRIDILVPSYLGRQRLSALEGVRGPRGMRIVADTHFKPRQTLSGYLADAQRDGSIND